MVAGLFTWDDAALPNHRELDIEFSRWCNAGDPMDAQYAVQPFTNGTNLTRFRVDLTDADSDLTHVMHWSPGAVTFETYEGHQWFFQAPPAEDLINSWTTTSADVPVPGAENVRINFWLFNGTSPLSDARAEFVVTDFFYLRPVSASTPTGSPTPLATETPTPMPTETPA